MWRNAHTRHSEVLVQFTHIHSHKTVFSYTSGAEAKIFLNNQVHNIAADALDSDVIRSLLAIVLKKKTNLCF